MLLLWSLYLLFHSISADFTDPYDLSGADIDTSYDEQDLRDEDLEIYNQYQPPRAGAFKNTGYVIFPFYNKVDGDSSALGVDAMYYFRRSKEPALSKPSYLRGLISAGNNSYVNASVVFNNYWYNEYNNLYSSLDFERRLVHYYKPFQQDPLLLGEYRSSDSVLNVLYRQRFSSLSYMGIKMEFRNYSMNSKFPPSSFISNDIYGIDGGHVLGLGFLWSSMEPGSIFSIKRGFDFDLLSMIYSKYMGSEYSFGVNSVDLREKIFITHSHIISLRFYGRFIMGEAPYFMLSSVGDVFRAYSRDLYVDRHLMSFSGEYKMFLLDFIMLRGILGIAYHSRSFSKFKLNDYLPCYGGGISFVLNKELGINAGFEYLAGRNTKAILFGIGEAY
jgi:hypothetical protein